MKRLSDALDTIKGVALLIVLVGLGLAYLFKFWLSVGGMLWDFSEGQLALIFVAIILGYGVAVTVTWLVFRWMDKPPRGGK